MKVYGLLREVVRDIFTHICFENIVNTDKVGSGVALNILQELILMRNGLGYTWESLQRHN